MTKALVKNAGDKRQVERAGNKKKIERINELRDIRTVMATPAGRRLLWRALKNARIFESRFHENDRIHAYMEGNANQGLWLMAELNHADQGLYNQMVSEHRQNEVNDATDTTEAADNEA